MATTASCVQNPCNTTNVYSFPEKKNNKHADNNNYYYIRAREDISLDVQMVAEMYLDTLGRPMPRFVLKQVLELFDAGIQPDMVCAVLAYTAGAPRPSWAYARAVIERQAAGGARTAEDFYGNVSSWRQKRAQAPGEPRRIRDQQYEQRQYDREELDGIPEDQLAEMEALR